jgi:hypothetical protein
MTDLGGHDSEHLSLKIQSKIYSENQELGNLNRFPVKKALLQGLLWDFGIEGQQSVAFQKK